MTAEALLSRLLTRARRRAALVALALWLPGVLVLAALALRLAGWRAALAVAMLGAAAAGAAAWRAARGHDRRWLVRRLDATRPDLEDSSDLFFAAAAGLAPLARLQRARLVDRLASTPAIALAPPAPWRRLVALWGATALAVTALTLAPRAPDAARPLAPSDEGVAARPGVPRLVGQRLRITPPAYTGLAARDADALDGQAVVGTRLEWTLGFEPQPSAAVLRLLDGRQIALRREGARWHAALTLDRGLLYRIEPRGGAARPRLHRFVALPDAPPLVRVVAPAQSLTIAAPGQKRWALVFEATDDFGVAPAAQLRLTFAQGEGENVRFRERIVPVTGSGPARQRRFAPSIDLAAQGFGPATDLVAQLIVHDQRAPGPQAARSPSVLLRFPAERATQGTGVQGLATRTMPAYFRSERQIIIDIEALLAERRRLAADAFVARSNVIGEDQRLLRMRYAQFLGQETEDAANALPVAEEGGGHEHDAPPVAEAGDDHAPPAAPGGFGRSEDVLADYGHAHDESEAATLFDPATRATLKRAVDAMFQAERALRQGQPAQALPEAHRALAAIKQVQQATRIFLSKVGPNLPPIDFTRRLTGKREGIADRDLPLAPRPEAPTPAPEVALAALSDGRLPDLDALQRWIAANPGALANPLPLAEAIDALAAAPGCARCRETLRARLWGALRVPRATPLRRATPDPAGQRYLRAIGG